MREIKEKMRKKTIKKGKIELSIILFKFEIIPSP